MKQGEHSYSVWIVNPFDNLPSEGKRPQRYWLMAEAFARAGHCVTLWTSDFSHATKAKRRCRPEAFPAPGFEIIQLPTKPYATNVCWARLMSHRQLARDFARHAAHRPPPDIVVASTPPLGLCEAALRAARACGAAFVCDIQDAWPETFERLLPPAVRPLGPLLFAPLYRTARRLYREADLVTGVCRRYAELSRRDDFHLAYHGIANTHCPATRIRKPEAPKHLVYIGNLGVGYDLETVIRAVQRRDDLTLDIAGLGPTEERLRDLVRNDERLHGRIRFLGYLDAPTLRALLDRCDVGLIPMRDDSWVGLPYKLGDYLAAGLPVLSSLHGECGALLERTGFGRTYEWGSPASLLEALDALPRLPVSLPDELCAERIYPNYVNRVVGHAIGF